MQAALPEESRAVAVNFLCGDATVLDWADADVIFANSTCFDEFLMKRVADAADKMKVGSFAITFTKKLPSTKWRVLESCLEIMTWGGATVFIQTKAV